MLTFRLNASAFEVKRTCVSNKAQRPIEFHKMKRGFHKTVHLTK